MVKTEKALLTLLETGGKVVSAIADDGKINLGEAIGISMKAVGLVGIFHDLPTIKEELKNITDADVLNLVEIFKTNFDLPNDEAEQKVEQGVEVLGQLATMFIK